LEAISMIADVERLPIRGPDERVAVLLNANAKSVTESLRRELENFVPPEDVFYSRTLDDAQGIARTVIDRGYRTVLTGGGDGTFVGYVNCILEEAARDVRRSRAAAGSAALRLAPAVGHLPRFGVLKLGTGNALADYSGASARRVGVVEDILRARSGEVWRARELRLLEHEGKRAPFAGLGLDAAVLNDYVRLKSGLGGALRLAAAGGLGYFCAIAGRTLPSILLHPSVPNVEIVNLGGPAHQIGPDGVAIGVPIERGGLLYRGPCRIAAAGTVPCYGYGFRIFPHALRSPGQFQLRLTALSIPSLLASVPAIWRGQTPRGLLDFHCDKVAIRFDREMPLQVGGDAEGYRREVVLGMCEQPLELLDFARA
jgi:diacylglycerol kinase family enzyme